MSAGIRFMGNGAVAEFCRLTGATPATHADKSGDALLDGKYVEIKNATGTSVSQVRALHFTPLVIFSSGTWIVVSSPALIGMIVDSTRKGQHGANPFVCCGFSVSKFKDYKVVPSDLAATVREAFEAGDSRPDLRNAMHDIHQEIEAHRLLSLERVKNLK